MDKLCYIHTIKYYSATKRNELLIHMIEMNPKIIMLNERSQTKQKKENVLHNFIYVSLMRLRILVDA